MNYQIRVENIKCGGCASTISSKLSALKGVTAVDVDIAEGIVTAEADEGTGRFAHCHAAETGLPAIRYRGRHCRCQG